MNDEIFLIQLRDCFTAGYQMPQFCIDNNIKKPLFIAPNPNYVPFLWELHVQFEYDMRMTADFALIEGKFDSIQFSVGGVLELNTLDLKNISEVSLEDFDRILILTAIRLNPSITNSIYLDEITRYFISRTYAEIPLLNFIQHYPKVKLIVTNFPQPADYPGGVEFNSHLDDVKQIRKKLTERKNKEIPTPFDRFGYTNDEVMEILDAWQSKKNLDGSSYLVDDDRTLVNIKNGRRMTAYQPEHYKNTIYFFGASHHLGAGAPYDKTIESYLQKMLNENNLPYRVENESQYVWGHYQSLFYNLNRIKPKSGDIIFIWIGQLRSLNIPFFDISRVFDPPHDYKKIFAFSSHVNEIGFKLVAEAHFRLLVQNNFFQDMDFNYPPPQHILTGTVYQQKIQYPPRIFYKMRSWKNTRKNCVKKDLRLAA